MGGLDGIDCLAAIGPNGKPAQKLQCLALKPFFISKISSSELGKFWI